MSEAKFTKGPWSIARALKMHEVCHITSAVSIYSECEPDEDASHDADLIASAPEMYAMLEQVEKLVSMDGMEAIQWIVDNCHDVGSLLAKSRGEK